MSVRCVPPLSLHAFRATRRRTAIEKREALVTELRSQLARAERELASWQNWWLWWRTAPGAGQFDAEYAVQPTTEACVPAAIDKEGTEVCEPTVAEKMDAEVHEEFEAPCMGSNKVFAACKEFNGEFEGGGDHLTEEVQLAEEDECVVKQTGASGLDAPPGAEPWQIYGAGLPDWELCLAADVEELLMLGEGTSMPDWPESELEVVRFGQDLLRVMLKIAGCAEPDRRIVRALVMSMGPEFTYIGRRNGSAKKPSTLLRETCLLLGLAFPDG